jgi:RNA polymerase sigma factor (sigma-70 family)
MRAVSPALPEQEATDEALMGDLAAGRQEALGPLYARYAPLVFNLAALSLDRAAAEDVVQDVFLAVWRKADTFDPRRGAFRPWVLQVAHLRIVNELRRRGRRPQVVADPDGERLAGLPDPDPEPAEAAWREYRRAAVQAAVESLPPPQRQALGLAFFEELTHEQVAALLHLPLGTAKTRIRAGLQKLRGHLAPLVVGVFLLGGVTALGVRYQQDLVALQRHERALRLVTTSDAQDLWLGPAPGMPEATHGHYRWRPSVDLALVNLTAFPPAGTGETYQVWVRQRGAWRSLGTAQPGTDGSALLIVEDPALAAPPDAVQVTREPTRGSAAPTGPVVVGWSDR